MMIKIMAAVSVFFILRFIYDVVKIIVKRNRRKKNRHLDDSESEGEWQATHRY